MADSIRAHEPSACTTAASAVPWRVRPDDPAYLTQARAEAEFWAQSDYSIVGLGHEEPDSASRLGNLSLTGNPGTTWLADLMARGPFGRAAALGCSDAIYERTWVQGGASAALDVYDLSDGVIQKVRENLKTRRFGIKWPERRVRFVRMDLNFVRLPREHYDVIWCCGALHHITNLELLFAEVDAALRPGGLFALNDYVGERRLQYSPERLELVNEALHHIPMRFRRGGIEAVRRPTTEELSPFCGVRSDEILPLARERFHLQHLGLGCALFPLPFVLDLRAIEQHSRNLLDYLAEAEAAAARRVQPCAAYAVFQKSPARRISNP